MIIEINNSYLQRAPIPLYFEENNLPYHLNNEDRTIEITYPVNCELYGGAWHPENLQYEFVNMGQPVSLHLDSKEEAKQFIKLFQDILDDWEKEEQND